MGGRSASESSVGHWTGQTSCAEAGIIGITATSFHLILMAACLKLKVTCRGLASRQVLAESPAVTVNMPVIVTLLLAETCQSGMEKTADLRAERARHILFFCRQRGRIGPKADGEVSILCESSAMAFGL